MKRTKAAALCLACIFMFSVAAAAAISLLSADTAALKFTGFTMIGNGSTTQGIVTVSLKNIKATGVSFVLKYDTNYVQLSNYDDNTPITVPSGNKYNTEHAYFKQDSAFDEVYFLDNAEFGEENLSLRLGLADTEKGYLIMNFIPKDSDENPVDASSSETAIGTLSFNISDPGRFASLSQDDLNNIITTASFSEVGSDHGNELETDNGIYISYLDPDTEKSTVLKEVKTEWEIKATVKDVAAQVTEKTVSTYEIYGDGTINDLFDYLNRNMSMLTITYTDTKQTASRFTWDSASATVSSEWNARGGGTYTVTQAYSSDYNISVTVNVTPITLASLWTDDESATYQIGADNFPTSLEDLNLPKKAHAVLSPYSPNVGIDDLEITWYQLDGESSGITALPDGFDTTPKTYTFIMKGITTSSLQATYPWLTVPDSIADPTVTRTVIAADASLPAELTVTSTEVSENGTWTIKLARSDAAAFNADTTFSIRLPDGTIFDTTKSGVTYGVTDLTAGGVTEAVITITADTTLSDYSAAIKRMINLGSRAGKFHVSSSSATGGTSQYVDCTPSPRANTYTQDCTFDYSASRAQMFKAGATLPLTVTLPAEDTVPIVYDGAAGGEPGALDTFTVDSWAITTNSDTGVTTAVGMLSSTSYANCGDVTNPGNYRVTILYLVSSDTATKQIADIPDFEYNIQQTGYDYSDVQTEAFTISNVGTGEISDLYISVSATVMTDAEDATVSTQTPYDAFVLRNGISPVLRSGESTTFSISTTHGLSEGVYSARVTIGTNDTSVTNGILDEFTVSFTVTDEFVYKITIKVNNEDYGTAKTVTETYSSAAGKMVQISAKPEDDCAFVNWTCDDTTVEFSSSTGTTSKDTSFTMPEHDVVITANFKETLAAKLRLSELIVKSADETTDYGLCDSDWASVTYSATTREYYAAVPNDAETVKLWFKPLNFTNATTGEFSGTLTVKNTHGVTMSVTDTVAATLDSTYYKTDAVALEVSPTENKVEITLTYDDPDDDPDEDEVSKTYTVHIYRRLAQSQLAKFGYGNSPYGLIMSDSAISDDDKATVKQAFIDNGYRFVDGGTNPSGAKVGVWYNPSAWSADNYDLNDCALFVYTDTDFTDTSADITNSIGVSVASADITKTVKVNILSDTATTVYDKFRVVTEEEITLPQTGTVTELKRSIRPGVYGIKYTFTDFDGSTMSVTKPLIVLTKSGDIDADASNTSDSRDADEKLVVGRFTKPLAYTLSSDSYADKSLYKYRVCDTNRDGNINALDANAIRKGGMTEYYTASGGGDAD